MKHYPTFKQWCKIWETSLFKVIVRNLKTNNSEVRVLTGKDIKKHFPKHWHKLTAESLTSSGGELKNKRIRLSVCFLTGAWQRI